MSMFNYQCDEDYQTIKDVSQNYPQLTTYKKEWLFFDRYGYFPGEPVELEYQTVQTNDTATVLNAVPHNYKRAILKGNTLVNIIDKPCNVSPENNRHRAKEFTFKFIKPNTDYFIIYDVITDLSPIAMGFLINDINWSKNIENISTNKGILKLNSGDYPNYFRIVGVVNSSSLIVNSIIIIEYQEGMENWDIPYFEGMKSVQMPVLTTTGKNLFNYFDLVAGEIIWGTSNNINIFEDGWYKEGTNGIGFRLRKCIKVKPNTKYYANFPHDLHVMQYKANGDLIKGSYPSISTGYVITSSETHYINLFPSGGISPVWDEAKRQEYQNCYISESEAMTSYEPYQSNILTVNEDVELRGIGEVQDELNLLTGELTQRIGEVVLDGSDDEQWSVDSPKDNINRYLLRVDNLKGVGSTYSDLIKCDKWRVFKPIQGQTENQEGIYINGWGYKLQMGVDVSRLSENSLNGFKQWLSNNPITVQYQLATESVKTVNLTSLLDKPYEGTNHYQISSDTINPTFVAEVPIVSEGEQTLAEINQATYQNL